MVFSTLDRGLVEYLIKNGADIEARSDGNPFKLQKADKDLLTEHGGDIFVLED